MVERRHHAGVTTFFAEVAIAAGDVTLDKQAAHHAQVRRLAVGAAVVITDGRGHRGIGRITALDKKQIVATIETVDSVSQPPAIHLFLPVADRERMLWLAEKATELQITTWNPVLYRRSRSVSPRGDGESFDRKAQARMISALEQSAGAWLPTIHPVRDVASVASEDSAYLLERGGPTFRGHLLKGGPVSLCVGPEGGFESDEVKTLRSNGWLIRSLGEVKLRFETAAVAAVAIARASLAPERVG